MVKVTEKENDIIFEQKDHKGVLIGVAKFTPAHEVQVSQKDINGKINTVWLTVDEIKNIAKKLV